MIKVFISLVQALALCACAAQQPTMTPLERAATDFVHAYSAGVVEADKLKVAGPLKPCEATVVLALTTNRSGDLSVDLKPPQIPVGLSGGGMNGMTSANTATFVFASDACAKAMGRASQTGASK